MIIPANQRTKSRNGGIASSRFNDGKPVAGTPRDPRVIVKTFLPVSLLLVLLTMASCASVPLGSAFLKARAEKFEPSPNRANIYVVRPFNHFGSALHYLVYLDYQAFGTLAGDTFLFGEIPAGNHVLQAFSRNTKPALLAFTAEEGKNYYFNLGPGLKGLSLKSVEEAQARVWVTDFQLSGDNVFDYLGVQSPARR